MTQDRKAELYRRMKAIVADLMQEPSSVWRTLASEKAEGDFELEAMVLEVLHHMQDDTGKIRVTSESPAPTQLGPYRILEPLGFGGMGIVYLAERTDQFRQKVAIKCLRSEFAKPEDGTRFHMERQILARLNHPNIAKILDGGITDQGVPYFVMEYIEGISLTRYADEHVLNITQRLTLFHQVCKAVHYANQNLIVHRDLKPGNILVEADGSVKLLDFGIAKLLDRTDPYFSEMTAIHTKTGSVPMTLQYASPEQYRGTQATIATDVYALGLLLYELLTGQPAYELKHRSREEIGQIILHQLPDFPSRRLDQTASKDKKLNLQTTHGMSHKTVKSRIAGDLDYIVMMALRKEPDRRYASANDLGKDIQAHLVGQPVTAHPEKWTYHFTKFVARNRLLVAFSTLMILSLLALTLVSLRFAGITRNKNIQIVAERDKAEAISQFMINLLEESDPLVQNTNPTLKEVLLRARGQLESHPNVSPEARAEINLTLVEVLMSYELFDEAEPLMETLRAGHLTPNQQLRLEGQRAVLLGFRGQFQQAWPVYDEVIAQLSAQGPTELLARLRLMKGLHKIDATQYGDGVTLLEALLEMNLDAWPELKISAWRNLGRVFAEMGHYEKADTAFDKAEHQVISTLGGDAMALYDLTLNRILTTLARGNFDEALKKADIAIPEIVSVVGEDHSLTCGAMATKGTILNAMGRFDEALALRLKALKCSEAANPEGHHQIIFLLNEIGLNYSALSRSEEAIKTYRQAIQLAEAHLPPGHLFQAITHTNLGSALRQIGRSEDGLSHNRIAYDAVKSNPDLSNYLGGCALLYGRCLQGLDRHEEALPLFDEAIQMAKAFPNLAQYPLGLVYTIAANSYRSLNRNDEATASLEAAFEDYLTTFGPDHDGTKSAYNQLRQDYEKANNVKAIQQLEARLTTAEHTKEAPPDP